MGLAFGPAPFGCQGGILLRLDKFLKVSRLLKRRTLAKDLADAGRIELNGRPAKPSTEVKPGDRLVMRLGGREIQAEILELRQQASVEAARSMVRIVKDDLNDPLE